MYSGVPMRTPGRVPPRVVETEVVMKGLATPKSRTFGIGPDSPSTRKMFSGLRSRWTSRMRCATSTAMQTPAMIERAVATDGLGVTSISCRSVRPTSRSITRNGCRPSMMPKSCTVTTFGCINRAASLASWKKRLTAPAAAVSSSRTTLTATRRSSAVSKASYTVPMPPVASR